MERVSRQQDQVSSGTVAPQTALPVAPGAAGVQTPQTVFARPARTESLPMVFESGHREPDLPTAAWNSAPRIPPMIIEPDIAQFMAASEMNKSQDMQMATILKNLKSASERLDTHNKEKMEKLHKRMDYILKEIEKQKEAKLTGDICFGIGIAATILSVIGAALLTFVTLGAAAPALIGAVVAACNTIMDCVDRGLKDHNVKFESGPLKGKPATASFAGLMGSMYEAMMVSDPGFQKLPKEEQEKRIQGVHIAMAVLTAIMFLTIGIACSVASVQKVASEGVKVASTLSGTVGRAAASMVGKGAEIAQIVADTANSATAISASVIGSQLAYISFESAELDNQKQHLEALAEAVQRLINSSQEAFESIQEMVADFLENVTNSNKEYYEVMNRVTRDS